MSHNTGWSWNRDRLWFTSDLHFFHSNIIEYTDRPWRTDGGAPDIHAMTEGLISNWNGAVGKDHDVFIIGDVAMGGKRMSGELAKVLRRLHGRKHLVPGNHDNYLFKSEECLEELIIHPPLMEIKVPDNEEGPRFKQRIVMCHYAMKVWNKSHRGAWNLFGHSHHTMPPDYSIKAFDVGIDGPGYFYTPLSYAQVKDRMAMHGQEKVDHHNPGTY